MKYIISFFVLITIFLLNIQNVWADYEYNMKDCFYFSVPDEFQSETRKNDGLKCDSMKNMAVCTDFYQKNS